MTELARPGVVVIVVEPAPGQLPHVFVFAPEGTRLKVASDKGPQPHCTLEMYDARSPSDLDQRLRDQGFCR